MKTETKAPDITPDDIVIALMGMTGVGKSSFIQLLTKEQVPIGLDLESCTETCGLYKCSLPGDPRTFWLADTPGFDDSRRSDYEILRELSSWLAKSYSENIKLTGIIYLHRILDVRLGGTAMRNLRMFKKLVGDDNLGSIVLATTFWNQVDDATGNQREHQLSNTPEFWGGMIDRGSRMFRHDKGQATAEEIIKFLLDRNQKAAYAIQIDIVENKKALNETAAGAEVQEQVEKLREKYETELRNLREEMVQAIRDKDIAGQREIEKLRKEHQAWIEKQKDEQQKAQARAEELWQTREAEREAARERQNEQLMRLTRDFQETEMKARDQQYNHDLQLRLQIQAQHIEIMRLKQEAEERSCIIM